MDRRSSRHLSRCRNALAAGLVLLVTFACAHGDGSDIGPKLSNVPDDETTLMLLDRDGKAVTGARLGFAGASALGVSSGNGRAHVEKPPQGTRLVQIAADYATADAADALHGYALRLAVPGGFASLAAPVVLPDFESGDQQTLAIGTLSGTASFSEGGATLSLASGTGITRGSAGGNVEISVSTVDPLELPPVPLPLDPATALVSRGTWVLPLDLGFGAGASLQVSDDLGLPASGSAQLWRFDGVSGEWSLVGSATESGGQIVQDSAVLPGGGLYVFSATAASSTTLRGRVVDTDDVVVPFALVSTDGGRWVRAGGDGIFALGPIPAVDASNAARSVPLRISASPLNEPRFADATIAATPGTMEIGDRELDALRVGQLRLLAAYRGNVLMDRPIGLGSTANLRLLPRRTDSQGNAIAYDVPFGKVGLRVGLIDGDRFYSATTIARLEDRWRNIRLLPTETDPLEFEWGGYIRAFVIERQTGAPLPFAALQTTLVSTTDRYGTVDEFGYGILDVDLGQAPTAWFKSVQSGKTYYSAYSVQDYSNTLAEFPLELAPRAALGNFVEHARLQGSLTGSSGLSAERRLLVSPGMVVSDWRRIALGGSTGVGALPRHVDPDGASSYAFDVGVPAPRFSAVGVEGSLSSGVLTPQRLGYLLNLEARVGYGIDRDIPLSTALDQQLTMQLGARGLDSGFAASDLRFRLGLEHASGYALPLHDPHGGVSISGEDALVAVPALGDAAGWLGSLTASSSSGGVEKEQLQLFSTRDLTAELEGFLPVPVITAPAHDGTVSSATDFTVTWQAMTGVTFYELEIRADESTELRTWRVFLPGTATSFRFGGLRSEIADILAAGKTWTVTLRASALRPGSLFDVHDVYPRLHAWVQSIGPGLRDVSRRSTIQQRFLTP